MRACIVVPTIRENMTQEFLAAWETQFKDHVVIVVEDNPEKSFTLPKVGWVQHVAWSDIDAHLGSDAWIIPRRSGAIRNYGNLLAASIPDLDMIVNLDDDCRPEGPDFLQKHWLALESPGSALYAFDTMQSLALSQENVRPRGFPKKLPEMRTMLNHGLWNGIPDIDGETQLRVGDITVHFQARSCQVPVGALFPMSAMNIAFRPELLPAMYNPPMGQGQPFNRFDDIWCGLIMKKACDAMGWAVRSGSPCVRHIRASDAKRNAEIEAAGIVENEEVWRILDATNPRFGLSSTKGVLRTVLDRLWDPLPVLLGAYWHRARDAAEIWMRLTGAP